jgi:hypothetical protein
MKMREAIIKTIALHQMVVDGKYGNYVAAKYGQDPYNGSCPLCEAAKQIKAPQERKCRVCPWRLINDDECMTGIEGYTDSPKSIIRLNRWLKDPRYAV